MCQLFHYEKVYYFRAEGKISTEQPGRKKFANMFLEEVRLHVNLYREYENMIFGTSIFFLNTVENVRL